MFCAGLFSICRSFSCACIGTRIQPWWALSQTYCSFSGRSGQKAPCADSTGSHQQRTSPKQISVGKPNQQSAASLPQFLVRARIDRVAEHEIDVHQANASASADCEAGAVGVGPDSADIGNPDQAEGITVRLMAQGINNFPWTNHILMR